MLSALAAGGAAPRALPVQPLGDTLEGDAHALYQALLDLAGVLQFRDRDCICCYDLSVTQCHALGALARHGALTLNELAAALYLEKSTASRVVDALERKGYATRQRHPEDGRALQVVATDLGRALHEDVERDLVTRHARLLADFDDDVRKGAVQLISRLAEAAAADVEVGGGNCCVKE